MARKKRKRSSQGSFSWLGSLVRGVVKLAVKVTPIVVLALLIATLYTGVRQALYADAGLAIRTVTVEPPEALSETRRQGLEAELLGRNILQIDTTALSEGLERNPQIHQATVIRELPDRVRVKIRHRKPFAYVELAGRSRYGLVSEDGVILDVFSFSDPAWPLIAGPGVDRTPAEIGGRIENRGWKEAVAFIRVFQGHPVSRYEKLSRVELNALGYVTITLGEGPEIRMGRTPLRKLTALERVIPVLEKENRERIDYVDLQFDDVVIKRKTFWR